MVNIVNYFCLSDAVMRLLCRRVVVASIFWCSWDGRLSTPAR